MTRENLEEVLPARAKRPRTEEENDVEAEVYFKLDYSILSGGGNDATGRKEAADMDDGLLSTAN